MPYKHTEKLIPKQYDKRVKLTDQDRIEIVDLYTYGYMSQRELARAYSVSRRLIVFVIYPERQRANYAARVANGGSKQFYNREKNTIAMKTHRNHKQQLSLANRLIDKEPQ